jgi:hypothetical protein
MRRHLMRMCVSMAIAVVGVIPAYGARPVEAMRTNIVVWGSSANSLTVTPAGIDYHAVALGEMHGLGLKSDGSIVGWGDNLKSATAPAGNGFTAIAAGGFHSLALRTDGSIVGWGSNDHGQATPPAGNNFTAIAAGGYLSVALRTDGSIVAWGAGDGVGATTPPAGNDFVKIAAGGDYGAALRSNGSIAAWGNGWGLEPPLGNDYTDLAVGEGFGVAIRADGSLVGWGDDRDGRATPPTGHNYVAVAASSSHALALRSDGSVVAWGRNYEGQAISPAPNSFVSLAAGPWSSAALIDPAVAAQDPLGEFTPLTPARVLDTRTGDGRGGVVGPLGGGESFDVQITGRGGVASAGVSSVVMNVTVAEPTAYSHLAVWPTGFEMAATSNLNFVPGQTVPNLVTVAVGDGGSVSVFNAFGSTHVIFDVIGYYADETGPPGSRFHSLAPSRLFDTRENLGGVGSTPLGTDQTLEFNVLGRGGVPLHDVEAVVMNVTVTQPSEASHLTVYPGDVTLPVASNLNYVPGLTVPNLVVVRVPASGVIKFHNTFGTVHVLADVVGFYDNDTTTEAGRFIGITPERVFDSRDYTDGTWGPDEVWLVGNFPGFSGIPLGEADAVLLNVTAAGPTEASYLTVFPSDNCSVPLASNLNFTTGRNVPNQVIVRLGPTEGCAPPDEIETIAIYNLAGQVEVIVDLFGIFTSATTTLFD